MKRRFGPKVQFVAALALMSVLSLLLFAYLAFKEHAIVYGYLPWNLFLAWIPFVLSLWLVRTLENKRWSAYEPMAVSVLWLLFLPNSFYMVSDFIHLQYSTASDILYDVIMFTSFIATAMVLGLVSLFLFHREFLKRFYPLFSGLVVVAILLACSFAIFIGRDLRWNSWDMFANPLVLLFDVSAWLLTPSDWPKMCETTFLFFMFLGGLYTLTWCSANAIRHLPRQN